MDNGKTTNEKLRALERWENEGGRVSRRHMEIIQERGTNSARSNHSTETRATAERRWIDRGIQPS